MISLRKVVIASIVKPGSVQAWGSVAFFGLVGVLGGLPSGRKERLLWVQKSQELCPHQALTQAQVYFMIMFQEATICVSSSLKSILFSYIHI